MYTQCPECLSVFSLDARTLAQAHGYVMCGHCSAGFDSLATLTEQLPPEPFRELPPNEPAFEPPHLDLVVYRPRSTEPEPTATPTPEPEDFAGLSFAPRFAQPREAGPRRWPWIAVCVLLTLLLAAQLGWACRDTLIANPATGNLLRQTCSVLHCRLPLVRDVHKLQLLARDVQTHPSVPGALLISATVRNNAAFAQPWPTVAITLLDVNGKRLAMRRLRPYEYLGDRAEQQQGLAPGATTALVFEVDDPGQRAVTFSLDFE
ncbi:zinc-ribbon and DUF3426 domain-containing protein [Rhodanobacter sp. 115]|jgi:predicted Zn finger-like uncharacterized protein|uniref:zinc-ribbon and DUF3426 domain-containing protein n=1 Tax=Rhodanobacter sp. FW021-MT20 TaxID=1162282 RepID=UPI0034E4B620